MMLLTAAVLHSETGTTKEGTVLVYLFIYVVVVVDVEVVQKLFF